MKSGRVSRATMSKLSPLAFACVFPLLGGTLFNPFPPFQTLEVVSSFSFQDGCLLGPLTFCSFFLRVRQHWQGFLSDLFPFLPGWAFIWMQMTSQCVSLSPVFSPEIHCYLHSGSSLLQTLCCILKSWHIQNRTWYFSSE